MGQEVRDQVLLRVDVMLRALPESPVVEAEPAVLRTEFAGAVAAAVPVQAVGEAVAVQDLHGVRGEEPRARPGPDLGAGGTFQDDAVDPGGVEQDAEHEPGGAGAEDDHIGGLT